MCVCVYVTQSLSVSQTHGTDALAQVRQVGGGGLGGGRQHSPTPKIKVIYIQFIRGLCWRTESSLQQKE